MSSDEPTPLSDQDKIRLKRIQRLQQAAPPSPATPTPAASTSQPPKKAITPPASRPVAAEPPTPKKAITVHPAGTSLLLQRESFPAWQDAVLSRVLLVTLSPDAAQASNHSLVLLKETADELLSEDSSLSSPLQLRGEWTDRLLLARLCFPGTMESEDLDVVTALASLPANETAFEYLGGCWKRERAERYKLVAGKKGAIEPEEMRRRTELLDTLKGLLVSYIGLVLSDPSMFPQDHISGKSLGPLELLPLLIPSSASISPTQLQPSDVPALLQDLSARYPSPSQGEDTTISTLLAPVLQASARTLLVGRLDLGNSNPGWRDHMALLVGLVEVKGVAGGLVELPNWSVKGMKPEVMEMASVLGPWMRLSTFPDAFPQIATTFFPDPSVMTRGNVESAQASLRGTLSGVQTSLFQVVSHIVRSSPQNRDAVLSLFGDIYTANLKRAAMRVDPKTVATHGFIINCHSVLLEFAGPIMENGYSKIDKIDPLYYKRSQRINIAEETKMNATRTESDEYYAKPDASSQPPNFISEIFFLTCGFLHVGVMCTIKEHKGLSEQIRHMQRQLDDMEADTTWRGTPNEAATQAHIDRYKKRREGFISDLQAYEVQLLDPAYLGRCVTFGNLLMAWLVRLVDPTRKHPSPRISLPLPEETPEVFKMLPEYLIEDLTELLSFTSKYAPQVLTDGSQDELITFMLVFLSTPYMKNPYLKGQFVEIMYFLTRPMPRYPRGSLGDVLNFHPLALKNLMPCLVHAYVQIEITGSHTQFYDKFNIRYYITQLFKLVWSNPTHREALKLESTHLDRYVRFANLLMNDTTFLLDDAILHLSKVADIQKKMEDTATWDAKPAAERQEVEKLLRQYEGTVKSDLDLGHESLRLLKLFSAETKEPFLTPEIVDRLAAMLDMNLNMLAGPRCQDLKVREPEKYKFRPKELLSDVLQIYLELGEREEFQAAVAKDGRSYSSELFERVERIARKTAIKTEDELAQLRVMVAKIEQLKAAAEEDDAMGDVPDEFLDPLTYDLMRDPVILPSSKTVIDRSTIKQHFLSDASDPFNRVPLKWEDIIDATDLKAQIDAFIAQRKSSRGGTVSSAGAESRDAMAVDG